MLKVYKDYLVLLALIIMMLIIFILAWQFIFSPLEDDQPSRSRMVWQLQWEVIAVYVPPGNLHLLIFSG